MSQDPAANPDRSDAPFWLKGNFAPVPDEATHFDLPVRGAIPPELRGLYLRNGPNPRSGTSNHWFAGDGMIHGVRLEAGRASWYRNRWVRTRALEEEGAQLVGSDGKIDHSVAFANTNVIGHAGRIFALVESSYPTELTPELDTVGLCDFDGRLRTSMTAHPKQCPETGELHFFGYRFFPPFLTYHRLDPGGKLVQSEEITVPGATMIHDFAITERHVVFMDLPIVFQLELAMAGRFPYLWSDDYGARLGVMPRGGRDADVRWLEIDPCYVFHPMNAYERDGNIVVDVVRYPELWRGGSEGFESAYLHRWTINLEAGKVGEQPLDDRQIEFPRVDDRRAGLTHRYGYGVGYPRGGVGETAVELLKYDLDSATAEEHAFGPGRTPGEAVFVPGSNGAGEEEGFVLSLVYDAARGASELVILDGTAFAGPPIACVELPCRVPFGFHGNWIPDAA